MQEKKNALERKNKAYTKFSFRSLFHKNKSKKPLSRRPFLILFFFLFYSGLFRIPVLKLLLDFFLCSCIWKEIVHDSSSVLAFGKKSYMTSSHRSFPSSSLFSSIRGILLFNSKYTITLLKQNINLINALKRKERSKHDGIMRIFCNRRRRARMREKGEEGQ